MARIAEQREGTSSPAASCVPVAVSVSAGRTADRADRMARFAAGARRILVRALTVGGLMVAGWLLAMLFGASPATAEASPVVAASYADIFPAAGSTEASVMDNAEAMAGLNVDGLTSQSKPGYPVPSTAGDTSGPNGLVPNGGGSGPFGPGMGVVARSDFDPRLLAQRAPLACVLPPVVRTAADDPSFSPD